MPSCTCQTTCWVSIVYDATYGTHPKKSVSTGLHMMADAVVGGNANLIHAIMTSSTHSEVYSSNVNLMIGKWIRKLAARYTLPQVLPTRVFGDNQPNEDMSNGGMVTQSRHIAQKVAYNAQEVRKGNFIFNHVPDTDNAADAMGKWVPPKKRRKTTRFIFNMRNAVRDLWIRTPFTSKHHKP